MTRLPLQSMANIALLACCAAGIAFILAGWTFTRYNGLFWILIAALNIIALWRRERTIRRLQAQLRDLRERAS